ncbi:MAG TPA: glycosyltransferase family 2 protein [Candidatus Thermoplasmatota archaeon]|nr:glycosyltransferase family 2 protein [Candidatus Thermoplasmatota archaeon]
MKVTLLVPTLNEEAGIGPTLDAVDRAAFQSRGWSLEPLVIDGDSKDRTRTEAERRGARVVVEPRRGYGRAYKRGFAEATGDVVVTADADGTYPVERMHDLVAEFLGKGLDFATCDRYADLRSGAMSAKHRFGNWVLSTTSRVLFRVPVRDSQSGMWILGRKALAGLDFEAMPEGMAFSEALKVEAFRHPGLRSAEFPSSLAPRIGEPVLASWKDGLRNLAALWKRRLTGRW